LVAGGHEGDGDDLEAAPCPQVVDVFEHAQGDVSGSGPDSAGRFPWETPRSRWSFFGRPAPIRAPPCFE
jgi:hypothetical protein